MYVKVLLVFAWGIWVRVRPLGYRITPLGVWVINYCMLYIVGHGLEQSLDLESEKHLYRNACKN